MLFRLIITLWHFFGLVFGTLYRTLLGLYKSHFYHFFIQLNPIKEMQTFGSLKASGRHETTTPSSLNTFYLLPLFIEGAILIDSLLVFAQANFKYSSSGLPRLFIHLIFPPEFYPQSDPMFWLSICMSALTSACLLNDPMLESKYVLYLCQDSEHAHNQIWQGGKALPASLSSKLAHYHHRVSPLIPGIMLTIFLLDQQFFLYFFFRYWTGCARDYLLFLQIHGFTLYALFSNGIMIIFYHLTVRYLRFKQAYLLEELHKLTGKLNVRKNAKKGNGKVSAAKALALYRSFERLQGRILALYDEISGQNRLWSKYLTLFFAVYIPYICIFIYGALFAQTQVLGFQRVFFLFFMAAFICILTLICYQSSLVVHGNIELHKQCLGFLQLIQLSIPLNTRDLLKFNNLAASLKFIPKIAFTLLNHQRINSKMFEMVVMYISTTYMFMLGMLRK